MRSSTFSFERTIPAGPWLAICLAGVLLVVLAAGALEWRLAGQGYAVTVDDTESRWRHERLRANALGDRALVLVGASRIQLGVDLAELRSIIPLEPVQLAIDGSSFMPVLRGLAEDPEFRGSVLVDYYDNALALPAASDQAEQYEQHLRAARAGWTGRQWEEALADRLHEQFRFFADGGRPLDSLLRRALAVNPDRQYLRTLKDRSRLADYRLVRLPSFYFARVVSTLAVELRQPVAISPDAPDAEARLLAAVAAVQPADNVAYLRQAGRVRGWVEAISQRGGRVVFVAMPTSGMVRDIQARRYPGAQFRDLFASQAGGQFIDSANLAWAGAFQCPDGSHLDERDRQRFTRALALALQAHLSPSSQK